MEKKLTINGKELTVKEIKYMQAVELEGQDKKSIAKNLLMLATGLTEDQINNLAFKEGLELQNVVNEVNGIDKNLDFQKPTE